MDSTCCDAGDQAESGAKFVLDSKFIGQHTAGYVAGYGNVRQTLLKVAVEGTSEQIRDHYNEIAEYYDEYCDTAGKETGAQNLAKIVHNIQPNKMARILDVACGNGLLGMKLKQLDYTNMDGLDFAQRMLDLCQSKGLFNNYICASIEPDKKVPQVADNTYDVVCLNGSMSIGLLTPECVPTLARMVKPGGFIVFNVTSWEMDNYADTFGEHAVGAKLQSFVDTGVLAKWSSTTHLYFEHSGEEAFAYISTVA